MGKIDRAKILRNRLDKDTRRILDSNRALLQEIRSLQKAPEIRDHGKNWYRIENASADEVHVYIYDEIGFWGTSAQDFVDELNGISSPKLNIHINSPGGEVFDGVAIHSALMAKDAHVTVYIDGLAASAASFIAMAGDRIVMARHATMMIHDASGLCWGNPADMRSMADLLDKLSTNIADMYALQAGGSVQEWRERMSAETWYTGTEALAAGLVDEITQPDPDGDAPENSSPTRLSLAAFKFSNRAEAPDPELPEEISGEERETEAAPGEGVQEEGSELEPIKTTETDESPEEKSDTLDNEDRARALAMALVATRLY